MKYFLCYVEFESDVSRMIDLGECKSVKSATVRVIRVLSEDRSFSPIVYDGGLCAFICDQHGVTVCRIYRTDHGYKFKAA